MISVNDLAIHFSGNYLFKNVSFIINDKDRIGLVGKNGSGKTTLLKIIAKQQTPEKGEVVIPGETTIRYLPQEMVVNTQKTVYEEAITAFSDILKLKQKINEYSSEIAIRADYDSPDYQKLINRLSEANEKFRLVGGEQIQSATEKVLLGLGFEHKDFKRPVNEFSYGWQMRMELAKILLARPKLLLLDEPTNHLDIESIQWVEEFLANYRGAVMLVSHDRAFLDNITKRTIEISDQKIYYYKAGYSDYIMMREERLEKQIATYNNQQKQIKQIERFIERFRYKSTKARQVQSRIGMLDKMDKIEIDEIDETTFHFRFPPAPRGGKVTVGAENISKIYGKDVVLDNVDFSIISKDKVAFVGKNGEGKTTLSKILAGDPDYSGKLNYGHNVIIGYYAQDQSEMLDGEKTVFETIDEVAVGDMRPKIRNLLGSFLFSGESIDKKVKVLSGGEKSRLALAKLLLTPVNFLILDEPTNHLDMRSKDILKNALLQFEGTLIIVSHDRDFLQGLSNKVFEFKNHTIREYLGDIYDFLETKRLHSLRQLEQNNKILSKNTVSPSRNKVIWERNKQIEKDIRKAGTQVRQLEQDIENMEKEINFMDEILMDPVNNEKIILSQKIYAKYEKVRKMLEDSMHKWETFQLCLEKLNKEKMDLRNRET
jgi:ATP-binding cassette subfamily F protein 3